MIFVLSGYAAVEEVNGPKQGRDHRKRLIQA